MARSISLMRLITSIAPNAKITPTIRPPMATVKKLMVAAPALNEPVNAAATAKRSSTSPDASLTRLSPSSSTMIR